MRLIVMAAERAPTMATMIQKICSHVGQCPASRAARRAPTRANGRAKTECSILIISKTVSMRERVMWIASAAESQRHGDRMAWLRKAKREAREVLRSAQDDDNLNYGGSW